MLLGKRQRHQMKRTTSMTEMTFDLNTGLGGAAAPAPAPQSDPQNPFNRQPSDGLDHQRFLATVSPRNFRRTNSADLVETTTAHFLRSCSLCKRRLVPGRDIYMYRGDSAFCSLECRQQQMNQDERMEKCSLASKKEAAASSTKGETVAAL